MSVRVSGANSPTRILVSNVKSSKSKANLSWLRALYIAHRKPNDAFVEADPDVQIKNPNHCADGANRNVSGRLKCSI